MLNLPKAVSGVQKTLRESQMIAINSEIPLTRDHYVFLCNHRYSAEDQ